MAKITKKDMFTMLMDIVTTADLSLALPEFMEDGETPAPTREDFTAFIEKQIDSLNRKASGTRKPSKSQVENDHIRDQILDVLVTEDRPMRIREICEKIPELENATSQRVVMLIRPMMLDKKVERTYIKKVAHYCAV